MKLRICTNVTRVQKLPVDKAIASGVKFPAAFGTCTVGESEMCRTFARVVTPETKTERRSAVADRGISDVELTASRNVVEKVGACKIGIAEHKKANVTTGQTYAL